MPDAFPIHDEHLRVIQGDALELAAVETAVTGQDAVLSTLGTRYSRKPITLFSVGVGNIVQAMRDHGVRRLVCVSSSVTDPVTRSEDAGGGVIFEKVLKPFVTM
jgi:putative NADH-flavin reductase